MPLRLLDLPVELLENILFYVPPSLLITRVGATCRKLRDVLQSESFWKAALCRARPRPGSAAGRAGSTGTAAACSMRLLAGWFAERGP